MFRRSMPEQDLSPSELNLEWERSDRRSQSFRVRVHFWNFSIMPMLEGRRGGKVQMAFEGKAKLGRNPNVAVIGDIEVRDDIEAPGLLRDRWKKVPETVEGYSWLSLDNDQPACLNLTLYCTPEALDWVSKVFVAGFAARDGTTGIDIDVGYPDDMGQDFWKSRWQSETLEVLTWRVGAGATTSTAD